MTKETKQIFGITINSKPELNTALIKEEMGHIPNTERNLLETDFITDESVKAGNEMANQLFAQSDKEFRKD